MFFIYRSITLVIYPILVFLIFFRRFLNKEDNKRFKEKIFLNSLNVKRVKGKSLIWFHSASIGELKSILPVIRELSKNKNYEFLITTVTLSSGNLAKQKFKNMRNIHHRYFPLDVEFIIKKFLDLWKPKVIFLVDSEIWPNLIFNAKKNGIPLALINARITKKTFKKWSFIQKAARNLFKQFDLCLTSNLETKKYLSILHAKNIYFEGNIKFIKENNFNNYSVDRYKLLKEKKFWCGISTHDTEEEYCLKAHLILKKKYKDVILIIAPRHINRVKKIKALCDKLNFTSQILDKNKSILKNKEIIIINSFGELSKFLKYAKSVFIGKSTIQKIKDESGQSPLEAVYLGCKIYHGPYFYNFKEIYEILLQNKISKKIDNQKELAKNLIIDLKVPKKKNNKFHLFLRKISKETFKNNMKRINFFLKNEIV